MADAVALLECKQIVQVRFLWSIWMIGMKRKDVLNLLITNFGEAKQFYLIDNMDVTVP